MLVIEKMIMLSQVTEMFGNTNLQRLQINEDNKIDYDYDEMLKNSSFQGNLKNFKLIFKFANDNGHLFDYHEIFWHALWSVSSEKIKVIEFLEENGLALDFNDLSRALSYSVITGNFTLVQKFSSIFEDYNKITIDYINEWLLIATNNDFKEIVIFLKEKAITIGVGYDYEYDY